MIIAPQGVTVAGNRTRLTRFFDHPCCILFEPLAFSAESPFMSRPDCELTHLWQTSLQRLSQEYQSLPPLERDWITESCAKIASLQQQLHEFFLAAKGEDLCCACAGACCERGTHHMTLANLLAYLQADELPPSPDFVSTCPFLDSQGCRIPVARRPFNCVTFICDEVEKRLSPAQVEDFYRLERNLRYCYEQFDLRYAGSSLRGFLIRAERLGTRPFLARC